MTDDNDNNVIDKPKFWQTDRLPDYFYDDRYVEAYCQNPGLGKSAALREAGYQGKCLRQEAHRIHNRLRERIRVQMTDNIMDGADLGYSVLLELAKDPGVQASVRCQAAKQLMDYGGRKPADTLNINPIRQTSDIDADIELLQQEIALLSNS